MSEARTYLQVLADELIVEAVRGLDDPRARQVQAIRDLGYETVMRSHEAILTSGEEEPTPRGQN